MRAETVRAAARRAWGNVDALMQEVRCALGFFGAARTVAKVDNLHLRHERVVSHSREYGFFVKGASSLLASRERVRGCRSTDIGSASRGFLPCALYPPRSSPMFASPSEFALALDLEHLDLEVQRSAGRELPHAGKPFWP